METSCNSYMLLCIAHFLHFYLQCRGIACIPLEKHSKLFAAVCNLFCSNSVCQQLEYASMCIKETLHVRALEALHVGALEALHVGALEALHVGALESLHVGALEALHVGALEARLVLIC